MPELQDQFAASIASEAVEVLEDHLLFPDGYPLPLSARGSGVPGMADRPWSRLIADVFYPNLPVMYSLALRREPVVAASFIRQIFWIFTSMEWESGERSEVDIKRTRYSI